MKRTTLSLLGRTAALGLFLNAQAVIAETIPPVALPADYEGTEVTLTDTSWVLAEVLDETGNVVLGEDGQPAMKMVPLETIDIENGEDGDAEASTPPGSTIVFEYALDNPTDAPLDNIQLNSPFPPEMSLDATSFSGPEGMIVAFSTSEKPDTWFQIYPAPPEADRGEMPSLDAIANLRVTVPQVPVDTRALVSYAAVVRQGTTATTTQTLESE